MEVVRIKKILAPNRYPLIDAFIGLEDVNPSDHVHHKSDMYVLQVTTRLDDMDVQSIM